MKLAGLKRKRILLLFFVGVILPSLLLGYLAFRGIKNDQALAEKGRLDAQRRNAAAVVRALDGSLSALERDFEKALAAGLSDPPYTLQSAVSFSLLQALRKFKDDHPAAEEVFAIENGRLLLPFARLLFWPKGSLPPLAAHSRPPSLDRDISAAERLEFNEKDYPRALALYRRSFSQTADPQTRGECLNAIARVQKKSGLADDALRSYTELAREFDSVRIADGIPLGLAARLELAGLQASAGDHPSSLKTSLDLYEILVRGTWEIERALYENTAAAIRRSTAEILPKAPAGFDPAAYQKAFAALDNEAGAKLRMALRMAPFLVSAAPELRSKLPEAPGAARPVAVRLTLEFDGNPYFASFLPSPPVGRTHIGPGAPRASVSSPTPAATAPTPDSTWGFLLGPDSVRDALLLPLLKNAFPPDETAWAVRGRDGRVLMASANVPPADPSFRTDFEGNFPPWSLELHALNPQFFQELLASRQRIYFLMFLLIAGILIFGMAMAARMVSHELELARMKSGFVSTVSHEFKSPLTSIRQIAEMLQAGRVPSEERRRQYHDILVEQSERLSLLVDNILSLAKIEDGRMTFELKDVEIGALLEETVAPIRERVRHEGFTIETETGASPRFVKADAAALSRAVTNLIDNAVKYSGDSRRIILLSSAQGPELVVSVRDFGVGIHKDDLGRIFDRFYRGGDPLTRSVKGSGLGLTLVKEIVDAHGGKVRVESKPGAGSTFSIILPLA